VRMLRERHLTEGSGEDVEAVLKLVVLEEPKDADQNVERVDLYLYLGFRF
jgi:hypothetical protein